MSAASTASAAPAVGRQRGRGRLLRVVFPLLTVAGLVTVWYELELLRAELERRPPVAIIEVAALAPSAAGADPAAATAALRLATRRLAAAGYVVLDGQAVLAAPSDLYVPPQAWAPETLPSLSSPPPGATTDAH